MVIHNQYLACCREITGEVDGYWSGNENSLHNWHEWFLKNWIIFEEIAKECQLMLLGSCPIFPTLFLRYLFILNVCGGVSWYSQWFFFLSLQMAVNISYLLYNFGEESFWITQDLCYCASFGKQFKIFAKKIFVQEKLEKILKICLSQIFV